MDDDLEAHRIWMTSCSEQADAEPRSEEDREIVLRHVAQMLPLLTDEERIRVKGKKDAGPLLQRLELQPGAGGGHRSGFLPG